MNAVTELGNQIWTGQQQQFQEPGTAVVEGGVYLNSLQQQTDEDSQQQHLVYATTTDQVITPQQIEGDGSVGGEEIGYLPTGFLYSNHAAIQSQSQVISAAQIQQQQHQQQQLAYVHDQMVSGGELVSTPQNNSVNGQFRVAPINSEMTHVGLQEHYIQQQQQIALQAQMQLQFQLQQQQQQMFHGMNNISSTGLLQLSHNFQSTFNHQSEALMIEDQTDQDDHDHQDITLEELDLQMGSNFKDEPTLTEDEEQEEQNDIGMKGMHTHSEIQCITLDTGQQSDQDALMEHPVCDISNNSMSTTVMVPTDGFYYQNGESDIDIKTDTGIVNPEEQQHFLVPQPLQLTQWQLQNFLQQQSVLQQYQMQFVNSGDSLQPDRIEEEMDKEEDAKLQLINYGSVNHKLKKRQYSKKNNQPPLPIGEDLNELDLKLMASNNTGKKIKPVARPGLVLKTPIAFQGTVDPSEIPIQKDGMAVCKRCGAIGVKHSFYTKQKWYCSISCARNYEESLSTSVELSERKDSGYLDDINWGVFRICGSRTDIRRNRRIYYKRRKMMDMLGHNHNSNSSSSDDSISMIQNESSQRTLNYLYNNSNTKQSTGRSDVLYKDLMPQDDLPALVAMPPICPEEDRIETVNRRKICNEVVNSYDWSKELKADNFVAAPVTCFRHAPGYEIWNKIIVNMKVEVENTDCDSNTQSMTTNTPHSFWVAAVLKIQGYKALLRYEGFDEISSHDFWVNLCSSEVHHVGWCATRGKPLIPPKSIENKYSDWKQFLMGRLYNARTLPSTFYNKLSDTFKSRFRVGMQIEIVDKDKISHVKLATIELITGKRLHVRYNDNSDGFCCHEDSALIHHVGWAVTVGHKITAPPDYMSRILSGQNDLIDYQEDDATIDLFRMNFTYEEYILGKRVTGFVEGMKLEAIDPLNPSSICVASVMSVLKFGYMMIRIDVYEPLVYGDDWFCYHEKSPYIFPAGFCHKNQIELTPPKGYEANNFNWDTYLEDTRSVAATEDIFHRELPKHPFTPGMKIECADLMDPSLVCVATVVRVVGRLLRINFDGWEEMYDQWLDAESPDMYPVGWSFLVKHRLEGPPVPARNAKTLQRVPSKSKRGRHKKLKTEISADKSQSTSKSGKRRGRPKTIIQLTEGDSRSLLGNESQSNSIMEMTLEGEEEFDDDEFDRETNTSEQTSFTVSDLVVAPDGDQISLRKETLRVVEEDETISELREPSLSEHGEEYTVSDKLEESNEATEAETLPPEEWSVEGVTQFLMSSHCGSHCETFAKNGVNGAKFLALSKDEIIQILGMKVGPALKIENLINQLKDKMDPLSSRRKGSKKFL